MVDDLILHGDGSAEHSEANAGRFSALLQKRHRDELAARAAAGGVGIREIRREQEADAAAHKRQRARDAPRRKQQHQQPPVDQQYEDHNGKCQRHPCPARHRKQAAEAHTERADPRKHLQFAVLRVIGESCRHRCKHRHEIAHDIGASEDRVNTRAHRGFRVRHPARRDGNSGDILINAMQRNDRRQNDQRQIYPHEIPVVVHQPRNEEEPEHILHSRAEAGDLDGVIWRNDVHENEADRNKQADRQIERIAARFERRFAPKTLIDHIAKRQQHQTLIPARRQDRHGQKIAQHVVDHDIHGKRK